MISEELGVALQFVIFEASANLKQQEDDSYPFVCRFFPFHLFPLSLFPSPPTCVPSIHYLPEYCLPSSLSISLLPTSFLTPQLSPGFTIPSLPLSYPSFVPLLLLPIASTLPFLNYLPLASLLPSPFTLPPLLFLPLAP